MLYFRVHQPCPFAKNAINNDVTNFFGIIHNDIYKSLAPLGYTPDTIEVELSWDPPWSESMMSEEAKAEIGII